MDKTHYHCSTYTVNSSYEWNGRFVDRLGFNRTWEKTGRSHWKEIEHPVESFYEVDINGPAGGVSHMIIGDDGKHRVRI